jgi:hypothetical protein
VPLLRLTIDQHSSDLWSSSKRRLLAAVSSGIQRLEWTYRIAEGGFWDGSLVCKLNPDGKPYDDLVRRGLSGVARIYWIRDETDSAAVEDESELLWFGIAEDAKTKRNDSLVELKLRGVGQFLKTILITKDFTGKKLGEAVKAVLDDVIAADGSPVTAKDVDLGGVSQRRVSLEFDRVPADRVLRELADHAGGPARAAWGIRSDADSDDMGTAYFKLWAGHLYEKDVTVERRIFTVPGSSVIKREVSTVNSVTVLGAEIDQRIQRSGKRFYEATVEAKDSINRFGRREKFIEDSGLRSDGQCALLAASIVKERGNRRMEIEAEALIELKDRSTAAGEHFGVLQRSIKWPGTVTLIRDSSRPYIPWGDSQEVYHATRQTGSKNFLTIDTSAAPTGTDEPLFDLTTGLTSGAKRLYLMLTTRSAVVAPLINLNVIELDQGLGAGWTAAGANWRLTIYKRNSAGSWVSVATSTAFTTAQLAEERTVAIRVEYVSGTQFKVAGYQYRTATGAVNIIPSTNVTHSTIYASAGQDRIYVNAMGSSALDTFAGATNGDSQELELGYLAVLKDWDGAVTDLMDDVGLMQFPFKLYPKLALLTNFGQQKAGKGMVRYAFGQSAREIGFDAEATGSGSNSQFEERTAAFTSFRTYSWLLGNELASRALGTQLELLPFKATVKYGGPGAPLRLRISGESGSRLATDAISAISESVSKAQENQRNG